MGKLSLLVIDIQNALVEENPWDCNNVISNVKKLIDACRLNNVEVIYIQHCGKEGGALEVNSEGWKIYSAIAPKQEERIFNKYFNSAFKHTKLKDYLEEKGIEDIIITGMQTEYCIDTTCKVAFEFGFNLIIPEKTNTTYDNGLLKAEQIYKQYNDNIFKDRFGTLESIDNTLKRIVRNNS